MLVRRAKVNQAMDIHLLINIFVSELSPGGGGGGDFHMRSTWGVPRVRVIFSRKNSEKGMSVFTKIPERAIIAVRNSR